LSATAFEDPKISVVIPVHNGARWLGETLQSLYAQTEPDFEIVVVDDASTDQLHDVLTQYADSRLRVVHLNPNVGVSAARNRGIDMARGPYIAFCDADDLCHQQRLALQLDFLEHHPEIALCGSAFTCFDTQDRETVSHPPQNPAICKALMQGNCFGLSTVMARAEHLKRCQFDPALSAAEDYDLWTRLVATGASVANLPQSLVSYRLHPQQASRHKGAQLDQTTRRVRALYCARQLGDSALIEKLHGHCVGVEDLGWAAELVTRHVARQPDLTARDFRFLLAWLYQQQPKHGLTSWWHWTQIQATLGLNLDRNYRINTTLLALLPKSLGQRYFDTLIKLKR
jgi:glycosyltransferase involved in cell wall biosynthesis